MDNGKGSNVEIGLNYNCDPAVLSNDWAFDCEDYGDSHLIKGLQLFFDKFAGPDNDDKDLEEYVIFLGYSGIVLREALLKVKTKSDFISSWGFHDGDLFPLLRKSGEKRILLANKKVS